MTNLVPIPWQPSLLLTPDTLALLEAASAKAGHNLTVMVPDGAWRSYARQKALYEAYLAGGNVASNPDSGQNNHMRGAAFDLADTSAATQAFCRSVGLIRDGVEDWHWNNPNWRSMPIIPTATGTASSDSQPLIIPTVQEDDMFIITHPNGQPALVTPDKFLLISAYTMGTLTGIPAIGSATAVTADAWTFLSQQCVPATAPATGGPVNVNAQVDVTPELITALKDPTVLAALGAAIKVPTKIESVLS